MNSKHWKNFSYIKLPGTDNQTKSRMTFYILHPYRRASTRNNMSKITIVFRVQCYVSAITEKYDLSFQFTYHTLAFDFQTTCGRTCSIQHVKDTTDSVTRSTYFKYNNFSITSHRSSHFKDFHFKENTERYSRTGKYTENTLHPAKNLDG